MRAFLLLVLTLTILGCEGRKPSFSLLPSENTFFQKSEGFNNKIDILWVIDNSGSMGPSQDNVAANFNAFISDFVTKNYDFNIAVTTTDAYKAIFSNNPNLSKFKDGTDSTSHTGYFIINNNTPNIESVFLTNIKQGIYGSADERAFQSFKEALTNSLNDGFLRDDSFLAIINISDEDDFSHDGSGSKQGQYNYSGLHTIDSYVSFLDNLTQSSGASRRYSFNSIHVIDQSCKDSLPWTKYGVRYGELAQATGGVIGDICGNFASTLQSISSNIIQLSTQFFLDRDPIVSTIVVKINGELVPQDSSNGWTYNPDANSILFHGSHIPQQGATININFDPATFKDN